MEKEKQERKVIHVEMNGSHYYFGSVAAIYEQFSKDEIGISYGSLRNYGLSEQRPYVNSKCIIRRGILKTIPKKDSDRE